MPPNIPGARKGVRPQRGSRKANARGRRLSSKKSNGDSGDSRGSRRGFGLLALLAAGVAAVVAVVVRDRAEHERDSKRIRDRLRAKPRVMSEHAACRMECRFISERDVERTLEVGKLDTRHSTPSARPCPKWALNDGRVRAVWADCSSGAKLVTVIDTETDHPCGPC